MATHHCGDDEVLLDGLDVHAPHVGLGDLSYGRHDWIVWSERSITGYW